MTEFAISEVETGKLNALVKNLMRQMGIMDANEAVRLVNSGEWTVSGPVCSWSEQDGIIYFSVTSDGTTGPAWIKRLERNKFDLLRWTKDVLNSSDFKPTKKGITYEIAVLKGMLFSDNDRYTSNIRTEADKRKLTKPNAEVACLIREKFSDDELEAMGLWWIITMHDPIKDSDGDPILLGASRFGLGRRLDTYYAYPAYRWPRDDGFAFVVSQV